MPPPSAGRLLLLRKYQEQVRKHLDPILDRLFAEFTGLHFHLAWLASPKGWDAHALPTGCSVCCKLSGSPLRPECQTCGPQHLATALESGRGHSFTCRLGVRNFWLPVRMRGELLGIAYLQALEHAHAQPSRRRKGPRGRRREAVVLTHAAFARASKFLRHIVDHAQTGCLCDLREADLSSAGRAVVALEREQARLHETLHRYLPPTPEMPRRGGVESHAEQVVRALLERIEADYPTPLTLQRLARDLGMNAAYVSTLFSQAVGIPFKTYLTELRLQKAKQLLGDLSKTASEVALAVGYASEERFRAAFKMATGLSPRAWRETMQTQVSPDLK